MSVCLETSTVLANQVSTATVTPQEVPTAVQQSTASEAAEASQQAAVRTIAKLPSAANSTQLTKTSLITVLNAPLGNVKTLCVTPAVSSNATGQFTVVNSGTPLNVVNSTVKPQTITLINTPVTVVKTIPPIVEKNDVPNSPSAASVPALIENRGHNVFVKNTNAENPTTDIPQSHKILTANNFPANNVITTAISLNDVNAPKCPANGQRNKVKILSNVLMPASTSQTLANKPNVSQRYLPRQKLIGANGTTTKYLNKPNSMMPKPPINIVNKQQIPQRVLYPTHKSQIKTLPPVNNYIHGKPSGIKTIPPHSKGMPGQIQRTGSGLRTIPPQRPQKMPNKPNYIGKHAVQAQKLKQSHKMKSMKPNQIYSYHSPVQDKQMTFNQALTAEIIETLSNKSGMNSSYTTKYENLPPRYDNAYYAAEIKPFTSEQAKPMEERTKSGLDLIYQAVLLDHNYNATLPPESPTRSIPSANVPSQMNGVSGNSMYSPGSGKRRASNSMCGASASLSTLSAVASNSLPLPDDDAASDISDCSDRKQDTEGEETDTAPEAEAVNNEDPFGDYVTRCICGFIHDDGYMVECDKCKVWQHVQCVVKNKQVPDEYLCEVCDPHKHVDRQKARVLQQVWLRDRQFVDPKLRKENKLKEVFKHKDSDSDSSDGEHQGHNNNIMSKRASLISRRKTDLKAGQRQRRDSKEVVQRRQVKKRERKVVKRKTKAQLKNHSDDEGHDSQSSSTHLPQLRQWIENYEEAVTNHYSPELRARISNLRINGAHTDLSMQFDPSVHKCRVHTQPLTELKYLVSTVHLQPNSAVIELRGKYMLSAQHRNSGGAFNTRQHAQRPGPFLFFYRLHKDNTEVCVDTRTYGNSARFIRRSCKPNAELRHTIVKGVLHLYIVTIDDVEKNVELTIKHESHDLAAIGTTHISCACGEPTECTVNRTSVKKNGDSTEMHKKRRGRRTTSLSQSSESEASQPKSKKETVVQIAAAAAPPVLPPASPVKLEPEETEEVKAETEEVKAEVEESKVKIEEEVEVKPVVEEKQEVDKQDEEEEVKQEDVKPVSPTPPPPLPPPPPSSAPPITTRRSSAHHKVDKEEVKDVETKEVEKNKNKKLSREERKLEAILKAIAQMEKADQRKQEHQAKQAHRRESEPNPAKEDEKVEPKLKRKRRKGRARTTSTNTQGNRRNRLNSTDSYLTSGDETLLSPNDSITTRSSLKDNDGKENTQRNQQQICPDKDVGLLLALSNGEKPNKSPPRETDSNSNSAQSSPETHLSSACLLVQAAVEPMEQGFKFPKTKKVLMNEWLNKVPEPVHPASSISPSSLAPHINQSNDYDSNVGFYTPGKSLAALAQVASFCDTNVQPRGSAKKRWLRQAISEDQCDSPSSRPESPPLSETLAPPKKRRLPRESLSNDITPPSTPNSQTTPIRNNEHQPSQQEGCVEIVYSGADEDSPSQGIESDAVLEERVAEMKEEFSNCIVPQLQETLPPPPPSRPEMPVGCLMDPRLTRDHHIFSNSDLVGTVEKTLSIFGFQERKPEPITPAKRKLSITEYRQRKKLNNNEKGGMEEVINMEENNSSEFFKPMRSRSDSTSSCTSLTSSDDEPPPLEFAGKAPTAFNSEPTELERQRELTTLRLKKALGLTVDEDAKKPALDVEAILNCELPSIVKTIPPSPTFPIPGSCDVNVTKSSSPVLENVPTVSVKSPSQEHEEQPVTEVVEEKEEKKDEVAAVVKPTMFYTPDDEERGGIREHSQSGYEEMDSVDYVPPFNNPVYPNDSNFTQFASVLDEEGRYEGRNPSPPPDLGAGNPPYNGPET